MIGGHIESILQLVVVENGDEVQVCLFGRIGKGLGGRQTDGINPLGRAQTCQDVIDLFAPGHRLDLSSKHLPENLASRRRLHRLIFHLRFVERNRLVQPTGRVLVGEVDIRSVNRPVSRKQLEPKLVRASPVSDCESCGGFVRYQCVSRSVRSLGGQLRPLPRFRLKLLEDRIKLSLLIRSQRIRRKDA